MGQPRLLDRVVEEIRARHYSPRTEEAYVHWIRRFVIHHGMRHPRELGGVDVAAFLSHLATRDTVAAATQNQALAALLFLYKHVLGITLPWLDDLVRATRPHHLPVVLSRAEVRAVLDHMTGVPRLMALLLYGAGLRLLECCHLRVKDVDFARNQVTVRRGKGGKDRVTMLPAAAKGDLGVHLARVRAQHERDLANGSGWVELPHALSTKLPNAGREWPWQWVFPATRHYRHARPASSGGTTCMRRSCRTPCAGPCSRPASRSARRATRSATRSRRAALCHVGAAARPPPGRILFV